MVITAGTITTGRFTIQIITTITYLTGILQEIFLTAKVLQNIITDRIQEGHQDVKAPRLRDHVEAWIITITPTMAIIIIADLTVITGILTRMTATGVTTVTTDTAKLMATEVIPVIKAPRQIMQRKIV
jgi:hypothetical protein